VVGRGKKGTQGADERKGTVGGVRFVDHEQGGEQAGGGGGLVPWGLPTPHCDFFFSGDLTIRGWTKPGSVGRGTATPRTQGRKQKPNYGPGGDFQPTFRGGALLGRWLPGGADGVFGAGLFATDWGAFFFFFFFGLACFSKQPGTLAAAQMRGRSKFGKGGCLRGLDPGGGKNLGPR